MDLSSILKGKAIVSLSWLLSANLSYQQIQHQLLDSVLVIASIYFHIEMLPKFSQDHRNLKREVCKNNYLCHKTNEPLKI